MPDDSYKVIVVVDRNYGDKLMELAPTVPVWIVGSSCNEAAAKRRWKEFPDASHLTGVTVLRDSPELSPEAKLLANLETIDLHHGTCSADPPYTVLEIVGVSLNENLVQQLGIFGFGEFAPSPDGFIARRPLPSDLDLQDDAIPRRV